MKKLFTNPNYVFSSKFFKKIAYLFFILWSIHFQSFGQYTLTNNLPIAQIAGTGTAIPATFVLQQIPIGFTFSFYGNNYTNVYLSPNGYLQFGTGLAGQYPASVGYISDAQFFTNKRNLIAFAWDTGVKPGIYGNPIMDYFVSGTAPNRVLVINFKDISLNNAYISGDPDAIVSVQLQLYEGSNTIEVHNLKNKSFGTNFSQPRTFGIANSTGSSYTALSGYDYSTSFNLDNKMVRIQNCTPSPAPTVTFSRTTLTCGRDTISLSATGCPVGSSVVWSNGQTGNNIVIKPQSSTNYSASCVSANHCVGISSSPQLVTVTNSAPLIIYSGKSVICPNTTKLLNAFFVSSNNGETTRWYRNGVLLNGVTGSIYGADSAATFHIIRNVGTCSISSDSVTLSRGLKPEKPFLTGPSTYCSGSSYIGINAAGCSGTITWVTGTTGTANPTYVSPVGTSSYQATCTSLEGCLSSVSDPLTMTPITLQTLTISSNLTTICGGDSVTITAAGCSGTISWAGSPSFPTIYGSVIKRRINNSTSFRATCSDQNCSRFSNVLDITVTQPSPTVSSSNFINNGLTTICQGDSLTLSASTNATGGTWQWYKDGVAITVNGTSNIYKAFQNGVYNVGYIKSGCTAKSTPFTLSVLSRSTNIPVITSNVTSICSAGNVQLNSSGCPSNESVYWYSNNIYTVNAVNYPIYQSAAIVTYTARCVSTIPFSSCPNITASNPITVTISTPPTNPTGLTASSNTVTCGGNTSITLTATGCADSYSWSANTNNTSTLSSISVTPNATTTYSVFCKNSTTGCLSTSSSNTLVTVTNAIPTISLTDTVSACPGTSGQVLTATTLVSGGTLQWANDLGDIVGANATAYTAMTTDNYKITQTVGACILTSKPTRVLIGQVKAPKITTSSPLGCSPNYYNFNATGCSGTVKWFNGNTGNSQTVYLIESTYIWAKCTMGVSCESPKSDSINVFIPSVTINPRRDSIFCTGSSYQLSTVSTTTGLSYQWRKSGGDIPGANSSTYDVSATGAYSVQVRVGNCFNVSSTTTLKSIVVTPPTIVGNTSTCALTPQKVWDKRFGGTDNDNITTILSSGDNGYLLSGTSSSGLNGDKSQHSLGFSDIWVVKTDSNGTKIWDKRYGGSSTEYGSKMIKTNDGNILLAGASASGIESNKTQSNRGLNDFWMVKTDINTGNVLWDKRFGGIDNDEIKDVFITPDNGYLLGGISLSPQGSDKTSDNIGAMDFWLIKTDANGNKLWDKNYGKANGYFNELRKIVFNGTDYFLCGTSSPPSSQSRNVDYWIVKVDANGNKLWDRTFGGTMDDYFFDAISISGGVLLVGTSGSPVSGNKTAKWYGGNDIWLVKIDNDGNVLWDKSIGSANNDGANKIKALPDGNFMILGYSDSNVSFDKTENSKGDNDFWMVKIDANGNKLWDKTFGGASVEVGVDFVINPDNSYVLAGASYSGIGGDKSQNVRGNNDYWMVKASSCQSENVPNTVVDGQTLTLKANGCAGTTTWTGGGITSTGASIIVSPSTTTTYTATCSIPTCADQISAVTVTVTGVPTPMLTASPSPAVTCSGSPVTLTASGCPVGTVYNWTPSGLGNAMSISVSPTTNTNYTVTCVVGSNTGAVSSSVSVINASQVSSINSGDYNVPTTWDCNCVPLPCSVVTINPTHNIVIPASITGKAKDVVLGGGLEIKPTGKLSLKIP